MKKLMALAAILLSAGVAEARHFSMPIIISTGGGYSSGAVRNTVAGKPVRVDFIRHINPDCSAVNGLVVRVSKAPQNGRIDISRTRDFPTFRSGDPRFSCSKRRVSGMVVPYVPKRGFTGSDSVNLEIITGTGGRQVSRYAINVR